MRNSNTIKRVGYVLLFSLLALVFFLVYDATHHEASEVIRLFSDREVLVIRIVCIVLGLCAGLTAALFVIRAFYSAFARRDCGEKHGTVA
jgi:hypothetical protein